MPSDSQSVEQPHGNMNGPQAEQGEPCPSCRAMMPKGMRFCRLCGFRLGEGVEEYTETVRFNGQKTGQATSNPGTNSQTTPFGAQDWGAMTPAGASQVALGKKKPKSKGPHWIVWVILAVIIFSVAGGSFIRPLKFSVGDSGSAGAGGAKSKFGTSEFVSVEGGAMIDAISPPGGPADKAGLLGGDIINSFDGQTVKGEDDIRKVLTSTPVGKTVDVVYVRDGETKTTKLTTVSEDELERLTELFDDKEGKGFIAEGTNLDRVQVPGMNIYGVQLHDVRKNRPAYISGLRDEDIVIEFGGLPMRTRREFEIRIERAIPDSTVKTVVIRNGERIEIPVMIGIE